jgi:hypothetical protein
VSIDFAQIPIALLMEAPASALRAYGYIATQTLGRPGWDLSYQQIAEGIGSSRRATAIEAVTWLVDHGWLVKDERPDKPNLYGVCREPGVRIGAPPGTAERTSSGTPERTHQERVPGEKNPPTPAEPLLLVAEAPSGGGFADFWMAYPGNRGGRKPAEMAWTRAVRSGVAPQALMDALRLFTRSEQWQRDGGRFIPHASTWLNQERYLDPPKPGPRKPFADAL